MIKENLEKIIKEIPKGVCLVGVSKKKTVTEIKEAVEAGIKIIAENKVQDALQKYNILKDYFEDNKVEYHYIGRLQSNKVNKIVGKFNLIQSVDSYKLAEKINNKAEKQGIVQDILLQVNIGEEKQKIGFSEFDIYSEYEKISQLKNIKVKGLMCLPPYFENPESTRPYFKKMKNIFEKLPLKILSMGMSNDYKIAIQEGSNMVRIGTKIFGERKY